jgi:hypothetical protein
MGVRLRAPLLRLAGLCLHGFRHGLRAVVVEAARALRGANVRGEPQRARDDLSGYARVRDGMRFVLAAGHLRVAPREGERAGTGLVEALAVPEQQAVLLVAHLTMKRRRDGGEVWSSWVGAVTLREGGQRVGGMGARWARWGRVPGRCTRAAGWAARPRLAAAARSSTGCASSPEREGRMGRRVSTDVRARGGLVVDGRCVGWSVRAPLRRDCVSVMKVGCMSKYCGCFLSGGARACGTQRCAAGCGVRGRGVARHQPMSGDSELWSSLLLVEHTTHDTRLHPLPSRRVCRGGRARGRAVVCGGVALLGISQ